MLNRTTYNVETKVVPVTRIVEKTITPDKVTDMYKDVREEVEKNIMQTVKVESNTLNGIVMQMRYGHEWHGSKIYTRFTLNGKEYLDSSMEATTELLSQAGMYQKLKDHYSDVVSNILMHDVSLLLISKKY